MLGKGRVSESGLTDALTLYLAAHRSSRSREARSIAAAAFTDTIGCIIAGSTESVVLSDLPQRRHFACATPARVAGARPSRRNRRTH